MATKSAIAATIVIQPDGSAKPMIDVKSFAPGPGAYQAKPVYPNVNTGPKFGTDNRKNLVNEGSLKVPAPNGYDEKSVRAVQKQAPSFGFGTAKRPQSHYTKATPGPGTYNLKGIVGTDTQGKTLASRWNRSARM